VTEFAREYGEGLYALCEEERIEQQVLDELLSLRAAFDENPDFLRLLSNLSISKEERVSIADQALRGQIHQYVLNFIKILVERGAAYAFRECTQVYEGCFNQSRRIVEADVTTARPLTHEQRSRLLDKLRAMTGKEVALHEQVDEGVLGGVLLQMDGKRYDNTLRQRLNDIRQAISGQDA
jgi:F-type H+-transporting ATPase subunit delta